MSLFLLISKVLISKTISTLAQKSKSEIINYFEEQARLEGSSFEEKEKNFLEKAFEDPEKPLFDFVRKLDIFSYGANNKGVLIVGPSGSGKTTLFNYLSNSPQELKITTKKQKTNVYFPNQMFYVPVCDTPGSSVHARMTDETFQPLEDGNYEILILMLANGYLESLTLSPEKFKRPGWDKPENSLDAYLTKTRQEEIDWINRALTLLPKNKATYCMVAVNKQDLWYDDAENVIKQYENDENIKKLASKFCKTQIKPSIHPLFCEYDSFMGLAPTGALSRNASNLSLLLFKAQIALRLEELTKTK